MKFARRAIATASLLALTTVVALAAPAKPTRPATTPSSSTPKPAAAAPATPKRRPAANDDRLDAVAAMVNDEAVLASDVEEQLYLFLSRANAHPDSSQLDSLRRQVLDQIIDEKLIVAEARRQAIPVNTADVAKRVDQAIADVKERVGGELAFSEQLKKENTTEAQLREKYRTELERQTLSQNLRDKLFHPKPVAQAEAEKYFLEHKDKFPKVPGEVQLSVIQIPPSPDSVALAAGLAKAQAIRKRIVGGEKFAKVAAETSEDPGSAKSGGDLGFFAKGAMEPALEGAAFSLKLGEISQPVRSPYGWHIVQAIERDTAKTVAGADSLDAQGKPVPEVHARHILIKVTPTDADIARAKALAEHVREEARKGTNFASLVRRYSKYDGPASPEGDVGFVSVGSLQPQIRAGLDSLEIGQVSEVLPNQAGYNIFKVTDRHPERDYTVDEIKNELPDAVAQVQYREKVEAWVKTLRAKAQIEYRDF